MDVADIAAAPYLPYRHARIGRVGESGLLPPGWRAEQAHDIRILDVAPLPLPWITIAFRFAATIPGDFAGLGLGHYLPVPPGEMVALSAGIAVDEPENIEAAVLVIREWRPGGIFVAQSVWSIPIGGAPQAGGVAHRVSAEEALAEAVLLIKRREPDAGGATFTLTGLAFGMPRCHPGWRRPGTQTV